MAQLNSSPEVAEASSHNSKRVMQNSVFNSLAPSNGNTTKETWQHYTGTATSHQMSQFGFHPTHFFILLSSCLVFQIGLAPRLVNKKIPITLYFADILQLRTVYRMNPSTYSHADVGSM